MPSISQAIGEGERKELSLHADYIKCTEESVVGGIVCLLSAPQMDTLGG